jgi:hypothetical protein
VFISCWESNFSAKSGFPKAVPVTVQVICVASRQEEVMHMLRRHRGLAAAIATAGTLLGLLAIGPVTSADAAPTWTHVCQGTIKNPGHVPAANLNIIVRGVCFINRGPVFAARNVIVTRHSTLVAAFARHGSRLVVNGNVLVGPGATVLLGCNPREFACLDDPHPKKPTLTSRDSVGGSLFAIGALGVVVHSTRFGHNVVQLGGGGGRTCKPSGPFAAFHSPVYSTYESSWIGGSILMKHLRSCWVGVIGNWVGGSATVSANKMADPDAMEVVTNVVHKDLTCWRNSPKVQFGDSRGMPNRVGLHAFLECSFKRLVPNPAGQHKHFEHISVHLH